MQILTKLGALRKKSTIREIGGQSFSFYPVRVGRIITGEMRAIVAPISNAFSVFMSKKAQDYEVLEEVLPDGTVARAQKPVSPEMARYRAEKREKTVKEATEVLFADDTRLLIGRLLMDSLRDDCPRDPSDSQIKEFVDAPQMDVPTFIEFIQGMMAANTSVFGDLGNLIRERFEQLMTQPGVPKMEDSKEEPLDTPETLTDEKGPTLSVVKPETEPEPELLKAEEEAVPE